MSDFVKTYLRYGSEESLQLAMKAADARLSEVGKAMAHDPFNPDLNITREVSIACIEAYVDAEAEWLTKAMAAPHPGHDD